MSNRFDIDILALYTVIGVSLGLAITMIMEKLDKWFRVKLDKETEALNMKPVACDCKDCGCE